MTDFVREITISILEAFMNIGTLIMTLCSWAVIGLAWASMAAVVVAVLYFAGPVIIALALFYFVFLPLLGKVNT
jgi:hypothetical protein